MVISFCPPISWLSLPLQIMKAFLRKLQYMPASLICTAFSDLVSGDVDGVQSRLVNLHFSVNLLCSGCFLVFRTILSTLVTSAGICCVSIDPGSPCPLCIAHCAQANFLSSLVTSVGISLPSQHLQMSCLAAGVRTSCPTLRWPLTIVNRSGNDHCVRTK